MEQNSLIEAGTDDILEEFDKRMFAGDIFSKTDNNPSLQFENLTYSH